MLRQSLEKAQATSLDKGGAMTRFVRARDRGFCRVPTEKAVRAVASLQSQFKFNAALIGSTASLRDVSLKGRGLDVILPTLDSESTMRELLEALDRIEKGTFGCCTACEGWIKKDRLMMVPHARLCIECQRKEEEEVA